MIEIRTMTSAARIAMEMLNCRFD